MIKVGYQSRTATAIQSNHGEDDWFWCTSCWTVDNPVKKSLSPPRKREYAKYPPPGCSLADGEFQSRSMIQEVHQCSEQNGMTRLKDNKHLLQRWPSESCTVAFRFLSICPLIFRLKPAPAYQSRSEQEFLSSTTKSWKYGLQSKSDNLWPKV